MGETRVRWGNQRTVGKTSVRWEKPAYGGKNQRTLGKTTVRWETRIHRICCKKDMLIDDGI